MSAYPSGSPSMNYTRAPGTAIIPTTAPSAAPDFTGVTLVKVNVKYTWNATLGGRAESEETETLISDGTKK